MSVSQETSAQTPKRRYRSPFREALAERTRARLIDAVITLGAQGRWRASAAEIATVACVHPTAISRHFGAVPLLYRVVARERWHQVFPSLPFAAAIERPLPRGRRMAVWAVLVGEPRD